MLSHGVTGTLPIRPTDVVVESAAKRAPGGLVAWAGFAGLILARTSVSLQYQNITVMGLHAGGPLHLAPARIGLLLTLYTMFGLVAAILSPLVVHRIGAILPIRIALILMAASQLAVLEPPNFIWLVIWRILAGLGGSLVYIMALDAVAALAGFGGLATRMGLIAATWPLGNALALVLAYPLAASAGPALAVSLPLWTALPAIGLLSRRAGPAPASVAMRPAPGRYARRWLAALALTWPIGLAFALYNAAFVLFTSLSAPAFVEQGYAAGVAGRLASLPMWLFLVSVPAGGLIATRLRGGQQALIAAGCLGSAAAFLLAWIHPAGGLWVAAAGILGGIPTAPLLTLAAERARAFAGLAYGTMFATFFAAMLVLPITVGWLIGMLGPRALIGAVTVLLVLPVFIAGATARRGRAVATDAAPQAADIRSE